jgi:hypothetical protein
VIYILPNLFQIFNAPPDVHTKQLIVLEVVDGPSVHFIYFLTVFFYLFFYLKLTFLPARVKTDTSTIEKRRTNILNKKVILELPKRFNDDE